MAAKQKVEQKEEEGSHGMTFIQQVNALVDAEQLELVCNLISNGAANSFVCLV